MNRHVFQVFFGHQFGFFFFHKVPFKAVTGQPGEQPFLQREQQFRIYLSFLVLLRCFKREEFVSTAAVHKDLFLCIALPRYTIGLKSSQHFFIQSSDPEPKTIVTLSRTISRALRRLQILISSFAWFIRLSASLVIG